MVDFEFEGGEIFGAGGGGCGEGIDIRMFRNGAVKLALGGDVIVIFGNLLSFMLSFSPCCDVFFGEETMSGIIGTLILAGVTLSLEILNGHDTDFWSGWLFFFFLLLLVVVAAISYQPKKSLEKTRPLRRLKGRKWWSTDFESTSDIEYVPAARSVVIF